MEVNSELALELYDAFKDLNEEVDSCLALLLEKSDDEVLNRLFRAIHNIKGNAGITGITPVVNFSHAIENVAESLRSKKFVLTANLRDCVQLAMDRLNDIHERELLGVEFGYIEELEPIKYLNKLAQCGADELDEASAKLITIMGSNIHIPEHDSLNDTEGAELQVTADLPSRAKESPVASVLQDVIENAKKQTAQASPGLSREISERVVIDITEEKLTNDLLYFQEIAIQLDNLREDRSHRSFQLFDWALKMNKVGGDQVNYEQLAAAIYIHDIGLSYLPMHLADIDRKLSEEEDILLRQHPRWAHDYLSRIPGWDEAADMALHHHEYVNGSGYPDGLSGYDIPNGSKILAIIDAFFSMINGKADKSKRVVVIKAISRINAEVDTKYDGMWVQCFNQVIRNEVKTGTV